MNTQKTRGALFLVLAVAVLLLWTSCATTQEQKTAEDAKATQDLETAQAQKAIEDRKAVEIEEYEGKRLSPFDKGYITSMAGPQEVDIGKYRLVVDGLVEEPLSLAYGQAMALPIARRLVTLHCYDGWKETLLFEGIRLADLLGRAKPRPGVTTVIFYAVDGYSSSLGLDFVTARDIILAARVNGIALDAMRGFPFQVVAEDKYGYKWVRWLSRIELSDQPYKGYTEKMGYPNEADLPESKKTDD